MLTPEQIKVLYKEIFNSDSGKKIIDDLAQAKVKIKALKFGL